MTHCLPLTSTPAANVRLALAGSLLLASASSCALGLDYSGDTQGLRREFVEVEGREDIALSYLVAPAEDAPRVIFIHGSPGLAEMYAGYLHDPVPGFEFVAVDRLGYGESRPGEAVVSFAEQAAAIAPLLEPRGGVWPILVGHSLGGPIAARLAADHPDRIGALVIVAGGLDPRREEVRWYNRVARWPIVSIFLAEFLRVSNEEMWACRTEVEELEPLLDRIDCPVVILHGTDDELVPFETVESSIQRFAALPQVFVMVLIGEGHRVTKEHEEEIRETLAELRDGVLTFEEFEE